MIRNTLLALATLAVAASASIGGAQAGSHGHGYGGSYKAVTCKWTTKLSIVGYDRAGKPLYEWRRVKICS